MDGNYNQVLYILNGEAESLSAYTPADAGMYMNCQLVGHNGSSEAWPNDLLIDGENIYVVNSGQNCIERYDSENLDYLNRVYLKNGFNPMVLQLLGNAGEAVITGYEDDEIAFVNLRTMQLTSEFIPVFVSGTFITPKNATGDNHDRRPTGMALSGDTLYVSNVRFDSVINYLEADGSIIKFNDSNTRAAGFFREGTLSVFSVDPGRDSGSLEREINLDAAFASFSGLSYHPGNGLNPQSLFVLNGKLHVVCTGTNGGEPRSYGTGEYIPAGYGAGDEVPGTNPDDGVILVMDLSDPENPVIEKVVSIGGSPVGFRDSIDTGRGHIYLAGVGGLMSYDFLNEESDRTSASPILAGSDPARDFYSHVLFRDDVIYVSDWTHDSLNRIAVSGGADAPVYSSLPAIVCGDGPGALAFRED